MLQTEPFFFKRGPVGCLLIHGFMACPVEMRFLGEYLAKKNITVSGIRLAGHGTTLDDMMRTTWRDWAASVERGYDELAAQCSEVFVAGLSMGGALTLYISARRPVPAAITFAAAALFKDWRLALLPLAKLFIKSIPKPNDNDLYDKEAINLIYTYDRIPISGVANLIELTREVRASLPEVKCPLLIMHGSQDRTVPRASSEYIYANAGSPEKELLILEKSGHSITVDHDRNIAFERTFDWIKRHSTLPETLVQQQ